MADLSPDLVKSLFALKESIDAGRGDRITQVHAFAALHGKSPATIYTWLKRHTGYGAGRKKRADAGRTKVPDETLTFIAAAQREDTRANGKMILPMGEAMNIADANGLTVNVSAAHLSRLLRQRRMDAKTMIAARNTGEMRSLYPNHIHQIDPSLCVLYYMHGKQQMMREEEFNKNKLANYAKVKQKVWRYVRYEDASGSLDLRYFEAEGETQESLFEFLLWTWGRQEGRLSYGVPEILLWDKGSANTSHGIQSLLNAMGVDHRTHAAGHAWAKGGVEQGNNLIETHFESRLRFEPVSSISELNAAAARWVRDWNANCIKHVDARITRASGLPMVRDDLWQKILAHPERLREMPERSVCQWFMTAREQTRTVKNLKISFAHPEIGRSAIYDLSAWAEFLGQNLPVKVTPLLFREGAIRVEIERLGSDALVVEAAPTREFDEYGRDANAPVWDGTYHRAADTADERMAKRLASAAYGGAEGKNIGLTEADRLRAKQTKPFAHLNDGKGVIAHSHLGKTELPARILPEARELATPDIAAARAARIEVAPLTHIEAAKQIKARLVEAGGAWSAASFLWLQQRYPDGVAPDAVAAIADELAAGREAAPLARVK
ncbi:MAG: hypothetical protein LBQ81_09700 [Zoogloeaceae bacterium]|nr:hypothetical protein [Zoogloeaceae bacterium]